MNLVHNHDDFAVKTRQKIKIFPLFIVVKFFRAEICKHKHVIMRRRFAKIDCRLLAVKNIGD